MAKQDLARFKYIVGRNGVTVVERLKGSITEAEFKDGRSWFFPLSELTAPMVDDVSLAAYGLSKKLQETASNIETWKIDERVADYKATFERLKVGEWEAKRSGNNGAANKALRLLKLAEAMAHRTGKPIAGYNAFLVKLTDDGLAAFLAKNPEIEQTVRELAALPVAEDVDLSEFK